MAKRDPRAGEPFSPAQVRTLMAGKVVVEWRKILGIPGLHKIPCPFGQTGERRWVQERHNTLRDATETETAKTAEILDCILRGEANIAEAVMELPGRTGTERVMYAADFGDWADDPESDLHWIAASSMPRKFSRLTVEQTIRVEQVDGVWWWVREWRRCND